MTELENMQTPMLEDQLTRLLEQKSKVLADLTALGENIKHLNNVHEQLKGAIALAQALMTPEDTEEEEE
mgnify:CR=1 FL=1|jgi:hypothetical protein|tara:strand:+ start:108 stop:314 length:207 start_codon:yes stop_codon:yes gene_type:complete